jgi:hypothetical protein
LSESATVSSWLALLLLACAALEESRNDRIECVSSDSDVGMPCAKTAVTRYADCGMAICADCQLSVGGIPPITPASVFLKCSKLTTFQGSSHGTIRVRLAWSGRGGFTCPLIGSNPIRRRCLKRLDEDADRSANSKLDARHAACDVYYLFQPLPEQRSPERRCPCGYRQIGGCCTSHQTIAATGQL